MKRLLPSSILIFSCAISGFAEQKKITPETATLLDFCQNPYAAICGEQGEAENARENKIIEEKERLALVANQVVIQTYPDLLQMTTAENNQLDLKVYLNLSKDSDPKKNELGSQALEVYFKVLTEELAKDLGNSFGAAKRHFEMVRTQFLQAAVEKTKGVVPQEEVDDMLTHLKNAKFVDAIDVFNGNLDDEKYESELVEACGVDGLTDNAFAWILDGKDYVVICPGDYVGELGPKDNVLPASELPLAGSVWTLGHEVGHLIDAFGHDATYEKFEDCFNKQYKNGVSFPEKFRDYMGEISGDYWGSEALAKYLQTLSSDAKKLRAIQESLEGICNSSMPDDGAHPNGRFRIENLVRRNPRIHQAVCLGWKPEKGHRFGPTCTLRGNWDNPKRERAMRFW